jgi:hypothetical protein
VEEEDLVVAKQQHSNQVFVAMNKHTTIEELLEVLFSMLS